MTGQANKHDEACIRRRSAPGWKFICSCRMTDEQVALAFQRCDSSNELPPVCPFPNCKCFE